MPRMNDSFWQAFTITVMTLRVAGLPTVVMAAIATMPTSQAGLFGHRIVDVTYRAIHKPFYHVKDVFVNPMPEVE